LIAVIADTHLPKGSRRIPDPCLELISGADAVIHAGDLTAPAVLDDLESLCPVVHAVHGNVDEPALRERLPEALELDLGGHRVAVLHDSGPARGRLARLRRRFPGSDAVIFGHSHLPLLEAQEGFQIFNPGSPTERRRAPRRSMGLLRSAESGLEFEHVWLQGAGTD
jgi:putative phosphoesterase